jgi:lantibiotic modifying enzyme
MSLVEGLEREAMRSALVIATELKRLERATPDRGATSGRSASVVSPHIYDGACGQALFLAALHNTTGAEPARRLALRVVAPLRAKIAQLGADPNRACGLTLPIGGYVGLGSFIYTFLRLADWLDDASLLDAARQTAGLLTPERIHCDRKLDMVSGAAGALLALLALYRATREDAWLDLSRDCGRHLLKSRVSYRGLPRAWPSGEAPPISGLAHGATGISLALIRLSHTVGERSFTDAALEGFDFERALYDPAVGKWLDPRFDRHLEQSAWCHGAPGMALGRAAALALIEDCALLDDLETCLVISRDLPDSRSDHLCCGNMGRASILLSCGFALDRPSLVADARALVERVLARAANGGFACDGDALFFGLAGVGYGLLQTARSVAVPSILSLDPP